MTEQKVAPPPRVRPSRRPAIVRAVTVAPHGLWCLLFILAPLVFVVYYTFTDPSGSFTMANLREVFSGYGIKFTFKIDFSVERSLSFRTGSEKHGNKQEEEYRQKS